MKARALGRKLQEDRHGAVSLGTGGREETVGNAKPAKDADAVAIVNENGDAILLPLGTTSNMSQKIIATAAAGRLSVPWSIGPRTTAAGWVRNFMPGMARKVSMSARLNVVVTPPSGATKYSIMPLVSG